MGLVKKHKHPLLGLIRFDISYPRICYPWVLLAPNGSIATTTINRSRGKCASIVLSLVAMVPDDNANIPTCRLLSHDKDARV
jgi:hypothetical protein